MCEFLSLTDGRVDDCILRQLSLQLLASKSQTKPVTYSKSTCRQLHGMTLRQMNKASRVVVARPFGFLFLCMQPLNVHETNEFALLPQLVQPPEKSWGQERDFCGSTQSACPGGNHRLARLKNTQKVYEENFADSNYHRISWTKSKACRICSFSAEGASFLMPWFQSTSSNANALEIRRVTHQSPVAAQQNVPRHKPPRIGHNKVRVSESSSRVISHLNIRDRFAPTRAAAGNNMIWKHLNFVLIKNSGRLLGPCQDAQHWTHHVGVG